MVSSEVFLTDLQYTRYRERERLCNCRGRTSARCRGKPLHHSPGERKREREREKMRENEEKRKNPTNNGPVSTMFVSNN